MTVLGCLQAAAERTSFPVQPGEPLEKAASEFVVRVGWRVLRENVAVLVDAAVISPEAVVTIAHGVDGVGSVHRVRSRGVPGAAHLDLHLQVDPDLSVRDAHAIAHRVEDRVRDELPEIIALRIENADSEVLDWIRDSVAPPESG